MDCRGATRKRHSEIPDAFMKFDKKSACVGAALAAAALIVPFGIYRAGFSGGPLKQACTAPTPNARDEGNSAKTALRPSGDSLAAFSVELSPSEFAKFKVEPVVERAFEIQRETAGTIDFNQEMSLQVFTPFPGEIVTLFAQAGDDVRKGATLFTIYHV
jgi:cobalt-zinc-cadmium efflux system membrane fusion protein